MKIPATSENSWLNANDRSIGNRLSAQRVLIQGFWPQVEIEVTPIVIKKHNVPAELITDFNNICTLNIKEMRFQSVNPGQTTL